MEYKLLNKYKDSLNTDAKMHLEHIAKYLNGGRASAMVGAGFSKNANTTDEAGMKDWNSLANEFYKRLFCKEPTDSDLKFVSPIRLASMVESSFGKKVLDEIIEQSLDLKNTTPGDLHEALLYLPWHDVFTTNYDSLLERTHNGNKFTLVENKESLLYSSAPRIIKLHGSFHHSHPYIISEEDYRTYPQKYPEMVNSVKQSLVENLFCLIGFSGNDPNFLSWLGWIRDIMGNNLMPVYLIAYDNDMHISYVNLLEKVNITVVNLANCLEGEKQFNSIQEGLLFFFEYLKHSYLTNDTAISTKKNMFSVYRELNDVQNSHKGEKFDEYMKRCVKKMESIRLHFPDWVVMPCECLDDFEDTKSIFPILNLKKNDMDKDDNLYVRFLYELDIRLTVSFTPKSVPWYVSALENLVLDVELTDITKLNLLLPLKVSLLSIYRQKWQKQKFNDLCHTLQYFEEIMDSETTNRFYCEKCLMGLYELNYLKVRMLLNEWKVRPSDVQASLWKSSIIAEVYGRPEAANYLLPVFGEMKRLSLITNNQETQVINGNKNIVAKRIKFYDWKTEIPIEDKTTESVEIERKFKDNLNGAEINPTYQDIAGFNINNHTRQWHEGRSGFVEEYYYAKRILLLYESIGMPMGLPQYSINKETLCKVFNVMKTYSPRYVLANIIRSSQRKLVDTVIDKNYVVRLRREEYLLEDIYKDLYAVCTNKKNETDKLSHTRIKSVAIPTLVKLCVALDNEKIYQVWNLVVENFIKEQKDDKFNDMLVTIYNCLPQKYIADKIATTMLSLPLVEQENEKTIVLPKVLIPNLSDTEYKASKEQVNLIIDGLTKKYSNIEDDEEQTLREYAYDRLTRIYDHNLSEEDKVRVNEAIYEWRKNMNYTGNALYSFNLLEFNIDKDTLNPLDYINGDVDKFNANDYEYHLSSETFSTLNNTLLLYQAFYKMINKRNANKLAKEISIFLAKDNNKRVLGKDDSLSFMGGMRYFTEPLFETINDLISKLALREVEEKAIFDVDTAKQLQHQLYEYAKDFHIPLMTAITALNLLTKDIETCNLMKMIKGKLIATKLEIKLDAALSLCMIKSNEESEAVVNKLISYAEISQGCQTCHYLMIICKLIYGKCITKDINEDLTSLVEHIMKSVPTNTNNENEASEMRFYIYELIGVLKKWNAAKIGTSTAIKDALEGKWGLKDEQKGLEIGEWRLMH